MTNQKTDISISTTNPSEENINIYWSELLDVIWNGRKLIIIISSVFAIASILFSLIQTPIFTATALITPAKQNSATSMLSSYSGIASLAGISLPASEGDDSQLGLDLLDSKIFLQHFINKHSLLPDLMAAKSWNQKTDTLKYDSNLYDSVLGKWIEAEPTIYEAHERFHNIMFANEENLTGNITLGIEHVSPKVASQWVNWLVQDINAYIPESRIIETSQRIEFLQKQLAETALTDLRLSINQLIQKQIESLLIMKFTNEFVFKTIDPAMPPQDRTRPKRTLIVILGTLFGLIISILYVLINYFFIKPQD